MCSRPLESDPSTKQPHRILHAGRVNPPMTPHSTPLWYVHVPPPLLSPMQGSFMGTWELGLTPMKFSLHGLHSVKIYEGHSQSGSRLLCRRMRVVPLQSRALCIEVWCAHGFCHSPQQVRRGLLSPSLGGEVETFRMVARLEHTGRKERMAVRECPLRYSRTCQQTEKPAPKIKDNEDAITVAQGDHRCHWKNEYLESALG